MGGPRQASHGRPVRWWKSEGSPAAAICPPSSTSWSVACRTACHPRNGRSVSNLSDHLFGVTIVLYVLAMAAFAADLAFRRKEVPLFRAGDTIRRTPQQSRVAERELVGASVGESRGPGSSRPVSATPVAPG